MRLVDADSLKENGFVVPKTFKKGDVYLEVRAEDMATETTPVRRFFINDKIIDAIPTIEAARTSNDSQIKECSICKASDGLIAEKANDNQIKAEVR